MIKGLTFFLKFSWKNKKSYVVLNILNQIIQGTMPLVIIAMPKFIIDELLNQQRIEMFACYIVLLLIAIFIKNWVGSHIELQIFNKRCYLSCAFSEFMHNKLLNTNYSNLETPDFHEIKEKANKFLYGDWHGFSFVLENAFSIAGKIITLIGIVAIIITMNMWLVCAFVVFMIISTVIDYKLKQKAHGFSLEAVNIERRWNYFTRILEDSSYSKEIRMNQIGDWLINEEKEYAHKAIGFYEKRNKYFSKSALFNTLSVILQSLMTYCYLIKDVIDGNISLGSFSMYVSAITAFSASVKDIITSIVDIKVYGVYYEALEKYINIKDTMRENARLSLPQMEDFLIEFKNVSFKYPGQNAFALKNINATIQKGKKISIVGENGSGKTTFIKLLCRLYDPTEGKILLNGVNIKDIDYDEYMKVFAAVFQDYKLFSFSVKENIIWMDNSTDSREKTSALLNDIGLGERINSLPKGIDTSVYKEFDSSGFEPSGGESQKIAITRAIAKDAQIVILDEPLSALDPKAENEMFVQFDNIVKQKTAIYISHRLSSCRLCDEILVFKQGEICEHGTHEQLLARNREYQKLYSLQAKYYI